MTTTRITLFTGVLVQDSALSISGLDRASSSDRAFTVVDGEPLLLGRGLKGAAAAMARRFFDPLPATVSDQVPAAGAREKSFRPSLWRFENSRPDPSSVGQLPMRAGVGILQKTGARASGVLHDREVTPAGTKWPLTLRVDWSFAKPDAREEEAEEAEGILGYVLAEHWAKGRCWLGGDVARGLGWCQLEELQAYRLDEDQYSAWVSSGRTTLPTPLEKRPVAKVTKRWRFRILDVALRFGEYRPQNDKDPPWGLDMWSVGPHDSEASVQPAGSGVWSRPAWADPAAQPPGEILTDRALMMQGDRPLMPGASLRGPLRHAFSRAHNAAGTTAVQDPHPVQGKVGTSDAAGEIFGTVEQSSRVLIRDAPSKGEWYAARLHMHAEDELAGGSYGSAKRDAVRLLRGEFSARIVVEGPDDSTVDGLAAAVDKVIKLGGLGHLPVGGHKTRGAGWGVWVPGKWECVAIDPAPDAVERAKQVSGSDPSPSKRSIPARGNKPRSERRSPGRASRGPRLEAAPKATQFAEIVVTTGELGPGI